MFFIGFRLRLKASENTAILIRLWKTIILFDFDFEIWSNLFLQLPIASRTPLYKTKTNCSGK